VCIEQEFQFCRASICSVSITDETISPVISILPAIEPIQLRSAVSGDAGTTSAIASPRRVTRSGVFVLLTWSSNDRHLALNSEIATFRNGFDVPLGISIRLVTNSFYHGHLKWLEKSFCAIKARARNLALLSCQTETDATSQWRDVTTEAPVSKQIGTKKSKTNFGI
jgi:hypothetical protein